MHRRSMSAHRRCVWALCVVLCALWIAAASAQQRPDTYRYTGTPAAVEYALPVNAATLNNVDTIADLSAEQTRRLSDNGFVVIPDEAIQMFYLYEQYGDWSTDAPPTPNFITVDSILHAYHLFFDFSLRKIETDYLVDACTELAKTCAHHSDKFSAALAPGPLYEAARADAIYFSIAWSLASGQQQTRFVQPTEMAVFTDEMARIDAMAGRSTSPLMRNTVHYDQFRPRGHYTRSEELKRYFRAMMWFGTIAMDLDPAPDPAIARAHQRQALLITKMLAGDDKARGLWAKIYEPTKFFVGGSDDTGFREYQPVAEQAFGAGLQLADLADESRLDAFIDLARKTMPFPGIAPFFHAADAQGEFTPGSLATQGRQFRVMGQRFIPDSYMLQNLVSPLVLPNPADPRDARDIPMGLDVPSVLGSDRAYKHLLELYDQGRYVNYKQQMAKLRSEFFSYPESKWWSNLYWGWIYSLQALLEDWGQGYPTFMRTEPWQDKELATALGSWSQLRHDTILYAKPSGAEMGAAEPPAVCGYVEPVPEAWGRLAYLAKLARDGLKDRGLLSQSMAEAYASFGSMLAFLKDCSEKELAGQMLSNEAYERIQYFGGELERLQLEVVRDHTAEYDGINSWHLITSEVDRNVATVADVHTSFGSALEEAVGYAYRIYVVVPDPRGGLQVTKGGVFSYYEFLHPVDDRLTDEKWLQMLKDKQAPDHPEWTRSFIVR